MIPYPINPENIKSSKTIICDLDNIRGCPNIAYSRDYNKKETLCKREQKYAALIKTGNITLRLNGIEYSFTVKGKEIEEAFICKSGLKIASEEKLNKIKELAYKETYYFC